VATMKQNGDRLKMKQTAAVLTFRKFVRYRARPSVRRDTARRRLHRAERRARFQQGRRCSARPRSHQELPAGVWSFWRQLREQYRLPWKGPKRRQVGQECIPCGWRLHGESQLNADSSGNSRLENAGKHYRNLPLPLRESGLPCLEDRAKKRHRLKC